MRAFMCGTAVALALATTASSQPGPMTPSSVPVHDLTIHSRIFGILADLADRYHVVIGIYGTLIGSEGRWTEISLKDGTLGDVFDAIVKAYPELEWKQSGSGVHFTFRSSPLPLLDVTVHSFEAENPRRTETSGRLARTPEVARWLQDHRCTMGELMTGFMPEEWGKFAIHTKDAPFSAVFDEIAAKSGKYYWSVIQYSAEPCGINIGF